MTGKRWLLVAAALLCVVLVVAIATWFAVDGDKSEGPTEDSLTCEEVADDANSEEIAKGLSVEDHKSASSKTNASSPDAANVSEDSPSLVVGDPNDPEPSVDFPSLGEDIEQDDDAPGEQGDSGGEQSEDQWGKLHS